MFRTYIKIAFRNILKNKVYSITNILGLAIGIACCILIGLYIIDENSYDKYNSKVDRIYRVVQVGNYGGVVENSSSAPFPLGPALVKTYPNLVESVVRFFNNQNFSTLVVIGNHSYYDPGFFYVDKSVFNIFDITFIKGSKENALAKPFTAVITKSIAKKYFGNENPIGKILKIQNVYNIEITAIIKDPPPQSHFSYNVLVSMETVKKLYGGNLPATWIWNPCWTYVLLRKGVNKEALESHFPDFIQRYFYDAEKDKQTLYLQSLADIHLNKGIRTKSLDFEITPQGNESYIKILSYIGIFLLVIAGINFMNLATASSSGRSREIGMKKVMGVTRTQLIMQFICETIVMSFIAMVVAISLVELFMPLFNDFSGKSLSLSSHFTIGYFFALILLVVIIGIISGLYPAFYLSAFKPVNVLRGNLVNNMKSALARKILVLTQFIIALTLITATLIAMDQLNYMRTADVGFKRDHIIILPVKNTKIAARFRIFKQELLQNPNITHVTGMDYIIGADHNNYDFKPEGLPIDKWQYYPALSIRDDFVETFNIKILAGRNYDKNNPDDRIKGILINESMVKHLGWKSDSAAIGKRFWSRYGEEKVIGVFRDFNVRSLHMPAGPFVLDMKESDELMYWATNYMAIRFLPGSQKGVLAYIKNKWRAFMPERPFKYMILDDQLKKLYKEEDDLSKLSAFFTIIIIFIAAIGLFGLVSFLAEKRTREIGIKKVMGSGTFNIIRDLSIDFLKLALISVVIAIPLTLLVAEKWLHNFAYRVNLNPWLFVYASGFLLLITLAITVIKSWFAARTNPVDTLKYE